MPALTPLKLQPSPSAKRIASGLALALTAALLTSGTPSAEAATTQTASCVDGGGIRWSAKVVWGATYTSADGVKRIGMDYAGWTTSAPGTVPTDSSVATYNSSDTRLQSLAWTGPYDYRSGATYKVRNPRNPPSAPGLARVSITLGVDGDGSGNCTMTFVQPGNPDDVYEADVITATNSERTSRGLAALSPDACVDAFAEAQSQAMATQDRMYHQDLSPILRDCRLSAVGENVAYGYSDGKAVTAAWMASPGHRANILNPRYRLIGVGATRSSQGQWYVSQVFGSHN